MSDSQRPPTKVRFEHGFIPELGTHCITSPDIKGFHILEQFRVSRSRPCASKPMKLLSIPSWSEFAGGESALGESDADAEREALAMVSLIHNLDKRDGMLKLSAVACEAA